MKLKNEISAGDISGGIQNDDDNENSILGEAKTNEKGEFIDQIDPKDEKLEGIQIDNYEINASVTDINGETQSANTVESGFSFSLYQS
jgi:hypothetical protein